MSSSYGNEENDFSAHWLASERRDTASPNEISTQQAEEIATVEGILNSELSPNKRAVIETLIQTWMTTQGANKHFSAQFPTSIEKHKSEGSSMRMRYR
ncbi:MAG: hypothetical protein AAFR31_05865 [Cyanobacteria bacterium J06627_8]